MTRELPLFVHSVVDDMDNLTPNAFRVYMHLARRADVDGMAWPSYQAIGDKCFGCISDNPVTRKSFARRAVDELIAAGLVSKSTRKREDGGQTSNGYMLSTVESLTPVPIDTPMPIKHPPCLLDSPRAYKGTEDTPIEDTPNEEREREMPAPSSSQTTPIDFGTGFPRKRQAKQFMDGIGKQRDALGLDANQFRELTDAVLEQMNATAIADQDTDFGADELRQAQQCALALGALGHKTPDAIGVIFDTWYTHDWRGEKGEPPTYKLIIEHAKSMAKKVAARKGAPVKMSEEEKGALRSRARLAQSSMATAKKFGGHVDPAWQTAIEKAQAAGVL